MTRVRTLTLCLLAVAALFALTAASAAAAKFTPEWGKCEPTPEGTGGKYGNPGCTAQVKPLKGEYLGGFEWYPLKHEPEEIEEEESSLLYYNQASREHGIVQPVSETTLTFANGHSIKCGALSPESQIRLDSARATTEAPRFRYRSMS